MVACTFSADTPNLVTGMVRENGVSKNWAWWAFLITGMVTVFIYAKLWRRSNVMTDLGFYELRYSGKAAAFLRGFRSIYLGLFFNVLIMGTVTLAAIKIGAVMLNLQPWQTVVGASIVVVIYASLGGLKGVIWADFFQYSVAMFGAVLAAVVAVRQPEVGGLKALLTHPGAAGQAELRPRVHRSRGVRAPADHPGGRAVVGGLVPGGGAGRRRLHRPAHAGRQGREERHRRHAALQLRPLRPAALAVDHRGPGLDGDLPGPASRSAGSSPRSPASTCATTWPIR